MPELEREVSNRIEAAQARQDAPLTRLEVSRIGRAVWRDAGAIEETTIRTEFMRITDRIGLAT